MSATPPDEGQVSLAFTHETSQWFAKLTPERRTIVENELRKLAREMEHEPHDYTAGVTISPVGRVLPVVHRDGKRVRLGIDRYVDGERVLVAFIKIDDGEVRGYRVDLVRDERMRRSGIPAIVVKNAKLMPYGR